MSARDHSELTQDERLRALERELVRSGRSLYEWAAAVVDTPVVIEVKIQPGVSYQSDLHVLHHGRVGVSFHNPTDETVVVQFSVARESERGSREQVFCVHGVPDYDFCEMQRGGVATSCPTRAVLPRVDRGGVPALP